MGDLRTQILDDPRALAAQAPAWEQLLARSTANQPTLSPAWLLPWWDVFGASGGRTLRCCLFRDGDDLVGFAPLTGRPVRRALGLLPYTRLELLGSGEDEADETCSDYLTVVAERGREEEIARTFARTLTTGQLGPCDELIFTSMDGEGPMPAALTRAFGDAGYLVDQRVAAAARYIRLPATFDAYLASLSSSNRSFIKRSLRDFQRWAGARVRWRQVRAADELPEGRRVLMALHDQRWTAVGRRSLFDSQLFRTFHEQVTAALLARDALELAWMEVDGRPLAALYNIVWDGRVQYYQSGRTPDVPKGIRPGLVLHLHLIEQAIAAGRHEYDLLGGETQLKRQLAPHTRPLVEVRAARRSRREAIRRVGAQARSWLRTQARRMRQPNREMPQGAEV